MRVHDSHLIREGPRSRVLRCRVVDGERYGASVVLKQITDGGACGFTDWAGLAFLAEVPGAAGLVPRFWSGDEEGWAFLMEDLGPSRSLEDVLQQADPEAARATLRSLAEVYARLHRAAAGLEERFAEHRRRLPGAADLGRRREAETWLAAVKKLEGWFAALQVTSPAGFGEAIAQICHLYADPGDWLTFTHGDPAPTNTHVAGSTVRLVDFEYGGYRHALYDLTAWEVLCPLPARVVAEMRRAYRRILGEAWSHARDDAGFEEHWAALCAFRALALLTWATPGVLEQNQAWVGDWTAREAVVTAVARMAGATSGLRRFAAVFELAASLQEALRFRWPEYEEPLPRWTAFSSGS